jgi:hypothetical protein
MDNKREFIFKYYIFSTQGNLKRGIKDFSELAFYFYITNRKGKGEGGAIRKTTKTIKTQISVFKTFIMINLIELDFFTRKQSEYFFISTTPYLYRSPTV